jgi:DNA (cytosine-5)-methyltransferase 1
MTLKILNLYAGIGGNRKLWTGDIDVTAIEINPEIAKIYQDFFPQDKVIVTDAHQYLLEHYKDYDFIWSSPPCPTHSVCNNFLNAQGVERYPDMRLYEEIIFLKSWFKGKWCVENVEPYYEPLITPQRAGRHCFWCNFNITNKKINCSFNIANMRASTRLEPEENLKSLELFHGIDLSKYYDIKDKRKLLRNCVKPELGLHILECAYRVKQQVLTPSPRREEKQNE